MQRFLIGPTDIEEAQCWVSFRELGNFVSVGGMKHFPAGRIHSFLKALGRGGGGRGHFGGKIQGHRQGCLLVFRRMQPKLTVVHVAIFPALWISEYRGAFSALYTLNRMLDMPQVLQLLCMLSSERTNEQLQILPLLL